MNFDVIASSLVSGFLLGGILALTALGLSISLGVMRLVNLAHGELLVGGAYLGYSCCATWESIRFLGSYWSAQPWLPLRYRFNGY